MMNMWRAFSKGGCYMRVTIKCCGLGSTPDYNNHGKRAHRTTNNASNNPTALQNIAIKEWELPRALFKIGYAEELKSQPTLQ